VTIPQSGATASRQSADKRPDVENASLGDLVGEVTRDLSTLMRQELELAKAELRQEAVKSGKAAGALGTAGLAGYMVLLFLSFALWWGLANVMDAGWAALIVAALWAIAAFIFYAVGRQKLRQVRATPQRTVDTLKEVPDALRGR
jgi:ABC-type multidrug transport system fused ATPase/permease subunit